MALPTLDATFASSADLPRKQMLAKWLVEQLGSGSIADYYDLPERYLWAKIAVAAGGPREEAAYISLPKNYAWSDIYNAIAEVTSPSNVLVSGFDNYNNTNPNGIYLYEGIANGKPSYRYFAPDLEDPNELRDFSIQWSVVEGAWILNGDYIGVALSISYSNTSYPWDATWELYDAGNEVPTLAESLVPSPSHTDWSENVALGHIAAAYRGDTGNPANLATYIDWPWRYKVASIIAPPIIPPFPNYISGLQLWLDGSDASTMYDSTSGGSLVAVNGAVARWEDKSGNNKHATQSVSNNRPLRKKSQKNGLGALEFDGANDFLEGSQVLSANQYTVIAVCSFTDTTEVGTYFGQRDNSIPYIYRWGGDSGKLRIYNGDNLTSDSSAFLNTWYLLKNIGDGANSKIFINNVLDATGQVGSLTPSGNYVIANFDDTQFQGIKYGELLVYNRILTTQESNDVHSYLNEKWGIY